MMELPEYIISKIKKAGYFDKKARDLQNEGSSGLIEFLMEYETG
ncbi:hypothetical protein [Listeria booriae]|nr:hypothetical protein [Listeria booriae]